MDDELMFAEEEESGTAPALGGAWKVMIVDDEPEIHTITKMALRDFSFNNRSLSFLSAHSGAEAKALMAEHPDTALLFLDVVMEHEEAGLEVVRHVRDALKNSMTRIILRTGQPGQAPERRVVLDYDINDYKTKTELTSQKLFTAVVASLRSYRDLETIHLNRRGLENIIDASASIFEIQSMEKFIHGVLTQLVSLLGLERDSFYCSGCFVSGQGVEDLRVLAGTGVFEPHTHKPAPQVVPAEILSLLEQAADRRESIFEASRMVIYFEDNRRHKNMIYMQTQQPIDKVDRQLLEIFCSNVAVAFGNVHLTQEMDKTQKEIVNRLAAVAETRSKETGNHIRRVAEYCYLLAKLAGLDEGEAELVREASTMHDIGKVGVPDEILNKPGKLTPEEFEVIKRHTVAGYEMFGDSERPMLQAAAIIARDHHERYAGGGYPANRSAESIHLYGRIAAIADVFDALGADRVYKKAWPAQEIFDYFKKERGGQFDPALTDLFLDNFAQFEAIRARYADGQMQ